MAIKKYTNEHGKFNQFNKYSNIFKKEKEEKRWVRKKLVIQNFTVIQQIKNRRHNGH